METNLCLRGKELTILTSAVHYMNKGLEGCKIMYTIEHMGSDFYKVTLHHMKASHLFNLGRIFEFERLAKEE